MGANAHNDYADRKNGRKPVEPIHPELAEPLSEILGDTYGLIVYQEQVMAIAQKLAGYSLGNADLLRRAMGKKKKEILDKEYVPFSGGMVANGYSDAAIKTLWEILVPFSDYAFNKAHTAGYGLVSYWTAFLKANYPAEYMAALLQSVKDDKDKSAVYLGECRHMGIKVLPPDVNDSDFDYTPRGTDIRFGLSAVRNVGTNVVESLIEARSSKGRFGGFDDFLEKVPISVVNKRVVESLIKAGAFDSLGESRKGLLTVHELRIDSILDIKRNEAIGQDSLFGGLDADSAVVTWSPPPIPTAEWDKGTLLGYEREMLGLYVSDHPLNGVEHVLSASTDVSLAAVHTDDVADGRTLVVGGLVTSVQRKVTKQGGVWAIATIEDLEASIDVMIFPQTYQLVGPHVVPDTVLLIKGRVGKSDEEATKVIAMEVTVPDLSTGDSGPVVVTIPAARCIPPVIERFKEVLGAHPGAAEVRLAMQNGPRTTVVRLDDRLRVAPSPALYADLKALLGPSCLQ
jgi:DNA polymerase-3 subunit alpha